MAAGTLLLLAAFHDIRFFQQDIGDLDPSNPEVAYFREFQKKFGDDETITLAVTADDVFRADVLRYMQTLSDLASRLPEVDATDSLINVEDVRMDGEALSVEPFLEEIPDDPAALAELRRRALGHAYWPGSLVSRDGTLAAIHVTLRPIGDGPLPRIEATGKLRAILAEHPPPPGCEVLLAGRGPIIVDSKAHMQADFFRFLWLTPVLIVALLLVLFRTVSGLVIPLAATSLAVLWTFGLFLWTGNTISLVITMLPTLIAVIGLSDAIHIVARYYERTAAGLDQRRALHGTMEEMIGTCFLTSLTTAIGIGSLALSGLQSVQSFALWSAVGIFVAYLLSITFVPAALALVKPPEGRSRVRFANPLTARIMERVASATATRPAAAIAVTAVMAVLSLGIARLEVDTRFTSNLPAGAPSVRAAGLLQERLAGTNYLNVVLQGPKYAFEEPENLRVAEAVQRFLVEQPEINHAFSLVDLLRRVNQSRAGAEADGPGELPADAATIATDLFRLRQTDLVDRLIDEDAATLCIYARLNEGGTSAQIRLLERVDAYARDHVHPPLYLRTTGSSKLFAVTSHELVTGQTRSLGFSFVALLILMVIALRSFRLGLLSMIPNVIPVVVTLGFMGYAGIPLGTSTVMISCVALGIAVDDTIHFLARFRRELGRDGDPVGRTMLSTGQAILFTTIIFTAGFSVFALSSFEPTRHFGLLTAFAMVAALLADVVLLGAMLRRVRPEVGQAAPAPAD